ncbi:Uncharacterized protein HZ326_19689 [Fusarium oxysporum f. sp. albedinis]|nr:Uncharacterized protein HZ326_19689 [Fusarium oxysporum f. sp. albedinis]
MHMMSIETYYRASIEVEVGQLPINAHALSHTIGHFTWPFGEYRCLTDVITARWTGKVMMHKMIQDKAMVDL